MLALDLIDRCDFLCVMLAIAAMKMTSPTVLLREWLQDPLAPTIGLFALAAVAFAIALWLILRNVRHNEPGLKAPVALVLALVIATSGLVGARRLPGDQIFPIGGGFCAVAAS